MEESQKLTLAIEGGPDTDAREVSELTAQLRQRLLELDVDTVELVRSDEIPEGAKPGDAINLGALPITLAPTILPAVVGLLKDWLAHRPVSTAKVTIDDDIESPTHPRGSSETRRPFAEGATGNSELTMTGTRDALIIATGKYEDPELRGCELRLRTKGRLPGCSLTLQSAASTSSLSWTSRPRDHPGRSTVLRRSWFGRSPTSSFVLSRCQGR